MGANIPITWQYTPQANQLPGTLSVVNNATQNTTVIDRAVNLTAQAYQWTVSVPAAFYYLALNDGSGDKYSGAFEVYNAGQPAQASAPAQ
ncbi:10419_t:CDS:1, partial [Racocetra fulgida]